VGFTKWLPRQVPGPWKRQNGQALWTATGQFLDSQEELMRQSLLGGFPTAGGLDSINFPNNPQPSIAPSDGLDSIGFDRGLPRGANETADAGGANDQAYAARLLGAWEAWKYGGSPYGILRALAIAGYIDMITVQQNGRYAKLVGSSGTVADLVLGTLMTCADRPTDPPGWMFAANSNTYWSEFGIVFTADASNLQAGGGGILSSGQLAVTRIAKGWKTSEALYFGACVILAGITLGWPTGRTLGTDPNLGGNSVRIIPGDGITPSFVEGP
jgi:hypothetical protein